MNSFCQYNGNDPDPIPGGSLSYNPDCNNIMSYSKPTCRISFVDEQGDFMYNMIQTDTVLQAAKSTICQLPYIVGVASICGDAIKTYTFNYANNSSNTVDAWSVSSNMVIISQSSTQIQVKRAPNQSGIGTITATINGYNVEKLIQLTGDPTIGNYVIQGVGATVNAYNVKNMSVTAATNATSYEWTIVNDFNLCPGQSNKPVFKDFNNSTQATTTSPNIWVNWGYCLGTFRLRCKAVSSCGFVYYSDKTVKVVNEPCPPQLTLTPNPATDDFVVDMMGPAPCRLSQPTTKWDGNITYSIYTNNGILVYKKEKANTEEKMNVKGLKKGMYYVEAILPDNQRLAKPLIVN